MNNFFKKLILLTFSGAYLLAVSVLHLLPELFHNNNTDKYIGLYILGGFLIQIFLELLFDYCLNKLV